ncbi:hypothetical protein JX265_010254 [Neoarthrinium moseri]|uniref:Uncharacterized protein n=1 Tax=Neoarthrinium moseri TaxID=1658444 RepID=A0A9P9WED4_9PEZI|nr:hypothetical protein JX265_010254 [Neoarthrinium moseri]
MQVPSCLLFGLARPQQSIPGPEVDLRSGAAEEPFPAQPPEGIQPFVEPRAPTESNMYDWAAMGPKKHPVLGMIADKADERLHSLRQSDKMPIPENLTTPSSEATWGSPRDSQRLPSAACEWPAATRR